MDLSKRFAGKRFAFWVSISGITAKAMCLQGKGCEGLGFRARDQRESDSGSATRAGTMGG